MIYLCADVRVRVQEPLRICLGAGAKAKTLTNNLPLLSVLAFRLDFIYKIILILD